MRDNFCEELADNIYKFYQLYYEPNFGIVSYGTYSNDQIIRRTFAWKDHLKIWNDTYFCWLDEFEIDNWNTLMSQNLLLIHCLRIENFPKIELQEFLWRSRILPLILFLLTINTCRFLFIWGMVFALNLRMLRGIELIMINYTYVWIILKENNLKHSSSLHKTYRVKF